MSTRTCLAVFPPEEGSEVSDSPVAAPTVSKNCGSGAGLDSRPLPSPITTDPKLYLFANPPEFSIGSFDAASAFVTDAAVPISLAAAASAMAFAADLISARAKYSCPRSIANPIKPKKTGTSRTRT